MSRLSRIRHDLMTDVRGWWTSRRLRAESIIALTDTVAELRRRIGELESDLDELRADSRRVAELRIQVEDLLIDRTDAAH